MTSARPTPSLNSDARTSAEPRRLSGGALHLSTTECRACRMELRIWPGHVGLPCQPRSRGVAGERGIYLLANLAICCCKRSLTILSS